MPLPNVLLSIGDNNYPIHQCHIHDHGINRCYQATLSFFNQASLSKLLNKACIIQLTWDNRSQYLHGLITHIHCSRAHVAENYQYTFTIESPLRILFQNKICEIFPFASWPPILSQLLETTALPFQCKFEDDMTCGDFWLQHQQSKGDFLQQCLSDNQAFFHLHHNFDDYCITFSNQLSAIQQDNHTIPFQSEGGLIHNKTVITTIIHGETLRPKHATYSHCNIASNNTLYADKDSGLETFVANYQSHSNMQALFQRRQNALEASRETIEVICNDPTLRPGDTITLEHVSMAGKRFRIINMDIDITFSEPTQLKVLLSLLPEALQQLPHTIKASPPLSFFQGQVRGGCNQSNMDKKGYYAINYDFDVQQPVPIAIPRLQPFASVNPTHGVHLPLYNKTKVLLGAVDNQWQCPMIINAIPHAEYPAPVTGRNAFQHILRSQNNMGLLMDDYPGQRSLTLHSQDQSRLQMKPESEKSHFLAETQGTMTLSYEELSHTVQKNFHIMSNSHYQESIQGDYSKKVSANEHHKSGLQLSHISEKTYALQSYQGTLDILAKTHLSLLSQGSMTLQAQNIHFNTEGNDIKLQSQHIIASTKDSSSDILIKNNPCEIYINEAGDLLLTGKQITLDAKQITIKGGSHLN